MRPHLCVLIAGTLVCAVFVLFAVGPARAAGASEAELLPAHDLSALTVESQRAKIPIVLMVSQTSCGYCRQLKEELLLPALRAGDYRGRMILRELFIDDGRELRDFDGAVREARAVAARYGKEITPTLLFVDGRGRELTEPIVGLKILDFYASYLDRAIDEAAAKLAR